MLCVNVLPPCIALLPYFYLRQFNKGLYFNKLIVI